MKIVFCFILCALSGRTSVINSDSTQTESSISDATKPSIVISVQSEKVVRLIETILHLPEVVKRSGFDKVSKSHKNIYIVLPESYIQDITIIIKLKDFPLTRLKSYKDLHDDQPGYVFTKLDVHEDHAIIQLVFDMTGMIVHGRVNYADGKWTPDKDFVVAYQ